MNVFVIALSKNERGKEWTLADATASNVDPLADIIACTMTRASLKVVMRFHAPSWEGARTVFQWKADKDRKVPKYVLGWEEARLLVEHQYVQVAENKV